MNLIRGKIKNEFLESLGTSEFINAMYRLVFLTFDFPLTTVNDCGGQMTSTLWRRLCKRYGINIKLSSAHHPETDSQRESANRVMKNYLRAYINHTQDNWVDALPMAEFAASNHVNASTGVPPFFPNHAYHPRTGIEPPKTYGNGDRKAELLAADEIVTRPQGMMDFLQDQLAWAQEEQARFANGDRQPHPEYKVGDEVYADARHFASEKSSKRSLNLKWAGPWKLVRRISDEA